MRSASAPELSLVVPTLNEADNMGLLIPALARVLGGAGIAYELLVCDDASPDGTADAAEAAAAACGAPLRALRRAPPHGLGHAILCGFDAARGRVLGVVDADMQHDETVLPRMFECMSRFDLAIGTRYCAGGGTPGWSPAREVQSRAAAAATRRLLGLRARDPLSGYFLAGRALYSRVRGVLSGGSWKVLLEILAAAPDAAIAEVPFAFRPRTRGESKLSWRAARDWALQLRRLRAARRAGAQAPSSPAPAAPVRGAAGKAAAL